MCTSRAWRDIIARIQAGYGHTAEGIVEPGALAIFCPACPQPGVNLPDNWEKDERRWVIIIILHFLIDSSTLAGCILGAL